MESLLWPTSPPGPLEFSATPFTEILEMASRTPSPSFQTWREGGDHLLRLESSERDGNGMGWSLGVKAGHFATLQIASPVLPSQTDVCHAPQSERERCLHRQFSLSLSVRQQIRFMSLHLRERDWHCDARRLSHQRLSANCRP